MYTRQSTGMYELNLSGCNSQNFVYEIHWNVKIQHGFWFFSPNYSERSQHLGDKCQGLGGTGAGETLFELGCLNGNYDMTRDT